MALIIVAANTFFPRYLKKTGNKFLKDLTLKQKRRSLIRSMKHHPSLFQIFFRCLKGTENLLVAHYKFGDCKQKVVHVDLTCGIYFVGANRVKLFLDNNSILYKDKYVHRDIVYLYINIFISFVTKWGSLRGQKSEIQVINISKWRKNRNKGAQNNMFNDMQPCLVMERQHMENSNQCYIYAKLIFNFLYTNPNSSRNHDPTVNTLEARLCGLPLSVDESAVVELLPLWAITLVDAVLHYGQLKPSRNTAVLSAGILDIREITVKTNPVVKICKTPSHKQGDTMCSLYQIQESFISLNGKIAFCQILNHVSSISSENNTG